MFRLRRPKSQELGLAKCEGPTHRAVTPKNGGRRAAMDGGCLSRSSVMEKELNLSVLATTGDARSP